MPRATLQTNFTSGEIDPELAARIDSEEYYNGAERLRNVIVKPLGGVDRSPACRHIDQIKSLIIDIDRSAVTATAPNGGTAANALDGDPDTLLTTTTGISTTNPYVIAHYDMGSAVDVASAEIVGASTDVPTSSTSHTGDRYFGAVENDNSIGTSFTSWTSPQNAARDGNTYAYAHVPFAQGVSQFLRFSGASLASLIPPGATINGIEIKIHKEEGSSPLGGNEIRDEYVQLVAGGVRVGTNKYNASTWGDAPITTTYGGAADLWGFSWTRDLIVRNDFGLAFSCRQLRADAQSAYARVREVFVKVYYTTAKFASPSEFYMQYSTDNSTWNNYGDSFQVVDGKEISQRHTEDITAQYWRVARVGSTDLGAAVATIRDFNLTLSADTDTTAVGVSNTLLVDFVFNNEQKYVLVFSDRNIAVYENGAFVVDVPSPYTSAQIPEIDFDQRLDTMIITHFDVTPYRLLRQGSSAQWELNALTFDFVPKYNFDPATSNPSATLTPSATSGSIVLTAGSSVFSSSHENQYIYGNGGYARIYEYVSGTVVRARVKIPFLDTNAIASGSWELQTGYEDVWSSARGYPKTVSFYQNRLWFGGTRSLPDTLFGSRIGLFFDFNLGTAANDDAIQYTIESDDSVGINSLVAGRHLQVFTESGTFYVPQAQNTPLTPSNFIARRTTRIGAKKSVKPVLMGNSTVFVQIEGESIRELNFLTGIDDTADAVGIYSADDITEFSSHLIDDPVDIAFRRAVDKDRPNLLIAVNSDGTAAIMTKHFSRKINAWTLRGTEGFFRKVVALQDEIYFVVEREVSNININYLEQFDENYFLDASVVGSIAPDNPISSVSSGLDHFEGKTVIVILDGAVQNPVVVSSGTVTFARAATDSYEIGLTFEPLIRPMPATRQPGESRIISGKKKLIDATIMVDNTQYLTVNSVPVSFQSFGPAPSPLDNIVAPFTGRKTIDGLMGWDETAQIDIGQGSVPVLLSVIAIERRVIF